MRDIVVKLQKQCDLSDDELLSLLETDHYDKALFSAADEVRREHYGKAVFLRGLIEFTNYCKNDCFYCGIRRSNKKADRYRLSSRQIYACADEGYTLGYRTFVLQGGEDPYYSDERICEIVSELKKRYPDCAVTLSIGERSEESFRRFFDAGADRYLLRHETADPEHYHMLHPDSMSLENRKKCLFALKEIGFQVGSGFMVGSPYQKTEHLLKDLRFLRELMPDMIGIGPYIHHRETPFADKADGSLSLTLRLIAVLRLMFPYALIPATTALGTIDVNGREMGLKAGANVVMPNLSPVETREKYDLYENKICTGEEAAQCRACLEARVRAAGYEIVTDIGHVRRVERR